MSLALDSKFPYGLHWAFAEAEGWIIIRIWNNTQTDMVRLVEFGPVQRPKTLFQKIRGWFVQSTTEPTPDVITLRNACARFEYIDPDTIEVPASLIELRQNGWTAGY